MDYEKAASYWEEKSAASAGMDREELWAEMKKFIETHNTCALATGCGDFVRCTPIEYSFWKGKFWMLSEGGMKFHALKSNRNVCLAIYDAYTGFQNLGGMQVTGTASLTETMSEEYLGLLTFRKLPAESVRKLPQELHLIGVVPQRIDFLWSGFKKLGFDARQSLVF